MNHRAASDFHAFITGAARGIGRALAEAGHGAGMRVSLADIDHESATRLAASLSPSGERVTAHSMDVTSADAWQRAVDAAENHLGPINLLINAAAVSAGGTPMEDIPLDQWRRVLETNVTGTFLGIKTVVPRLKARGQAAHIVNVASGAGLIATPGLGAFHASKYAVVGLSEALRLELAPHDIGVTVVCPGPAHGISTSPGRAAALTFRSRAVSPDSVALQTLTAILENDPYVITHAELLPAVKSRFEAILDAFADHPSKTH